MGWELDLYWHSARNLVRFISYMWYPPDSSPAPACLRPPLLVLSRRFSSPPFLLSRPPSGHFFSTNSSASHSASPAPSSVRRPVPRPAPNRRPTACPVRPRSPRYLSAVLGRLGSRNSPAKPRTTPWSSRPCSTARCPRTPGTRRRCSHRGTYLPRSSSRSPGTPG